MPTRLTTSQIYGPCHNPKSYGKGIKIHRIRCCFQTALKLGIFSHAHIVKSEALEKDGMLSNP